MKTTITQSETAHNKKIQREINKLVEEQQYHSQQDEPDYQYLSDLEDRITRLNEKMIVK